MSPKKHEEANGGSRSRMVEEEKKPNNNTHRPSVGLLAAALLLGHDPLLALDPDLLSLCSINHGRVRTEAAHVETDTQTHRHTDTHGHI
jgi:hypothetical protein